MSDLKNDKAIVLGSVRAVDEAEGDKIIEDSKIITSDQVKEAVETLDISLSQDPTLLKEHNLSALAFFYYVVSLAEDAGFYFQDEDGSVSVYVLAPEDEEDTKPTLQ